MAGYIFSLDNQASLKLYAENGVYSTKLSEPKTMWRIHHEGTFADYATMKSGDNIYFFIDRKIYGIGELVNIKSAKSGNQCKYSNYPKACIPMPFQYSKEKKSLLWDEGKNSINQRWICIFKPSPCFFTNGIDMDDVLQSNPDAFKMLRAFWKLSFVKFDDQENQAFRDIILKINNNVLENKTPGENVYLDNSKVTHSNILSKLNKTDYSIDVAPFLNTCNEDSRIRHEMAIEAALLYQLSHKDAASTDVFGTWDYLSHQVIASPFKPIDYMDKMDVFGYSYVVGYAPTRSAYLLAELKRDEASIEDVEQVLKYVDWVKDEYCFNDYSMINAFLVAYDFDQNVIEFNKDNAKRFYTIGRRPAKSGKWQNLKLVKYSYNIKKDRLDFDVIQ